MTPPVIAEGGRARETLPHIPLGATIQIAAYLKRRRGEMLLTAGRRYWQRTPFPAPVLATFVGWRTLTDGHVRYYGSDGGMEYRPETHRAACLAVRHERRRPLLVLVEDITVVRPEQLFAFPSPSDVDQTALAEYVLAQTPESLHPVVRAALRHVAHFMSTM